MMIGIILFLIIFFVIAIFMNTGFDQLTREQQLFYIKNNSEYVPYVEEQKDLMSLSEIQREIRKKAIEEFELLEKITRNEFAKIYFTC